MLGFMEKLREYPAVFDELFIEVTDILTSTTLDLIFYEINFLAEGSNKRAAEERVLGYWRDFFQDIEGIKSIALYTML